jgi:hypothetical protein
MEAPPGWINQSSEAGEVDVGSEVSRNDGIEGDDNEEDGEDVGTALDVSDGTRGEMMAWNTNQGKCHQPTRMHLRTIPADRLTFQPHSSTLNPRSGTVSGKVAVNVLITSKLDFSRENAPQYHLLIRQPSQTPLNLIPLPRPTLTSVQQLPTSNDHRTRTITKQTNPNIPHLPTRSI